MSLRGLQLDYPLFVAEFLDKDHVIVGGGGGEGNHGIPNKLVSIAGRWFDFGAIFDAGVD